MGEGVAYCQLFSSETCEGNVLEMTLWSQVNLDEKRARSIRCYPFGAPIPLDSK